MCILHDHPCSLCSIQSFHRIYHHADFCITWAGNQAGLLHGRFTYYRASGNYRDYRGILLYSRGGHYRSRGILQDKWAGEQCVVITLTFERTKGVGDIKSDRTA